MKRPKKKTKADKIREASGKLRKGLAKELNEMEDIWTDEDEIADIERQIIEDNKL